MVFDDEFLRFSLGLIATMAGLAWAINNPYLLVGTGVAFMAYGAWKLLQYKKME